MNQLTKLYASKPCPKCGAAEGVNCPIEVADFLHVACRERVNLFANHHGRHFKEQTMRAPLVKVSTYSEVCNDNAHFLCSGFKAKNHGIQPRCHCPCHRRKKVTPVETDPNL